MRHPIRNTALLGLGLVIFAMVAFPGHNGTAPAGQGIVGGIGLFLLTMVPLGYCLWNLNRGINRTCSPQAGHPRPSDDPAAVRRIDGPGADCRRGPRHPRDGYGRHNQALLGVGILAGGAVLGAHAPNSRGLL